MRRFTAALARALLLAMGAMPLSIGLALAAHEAPRLGLTPVGEQGSYFELTMEPGETRFLEVEVANFGDEEAVARTYAADAYSIVNGGFGSELFGDEASGTTRWLDYSTQELTLAPRDALVVGFAVSVPDSATPGEYLTSLVVENAEPFVAVGEGDFGLEQVNRSAIAVAIDVPGPRRPELRIGALGHTVAEGRSVVTFEVTNPGNLHLRPAGAFALRDEAGDELASAELAMDSLYAGSSTILEAPLTSPLAPGSYCAELRLADASTDARDATDCVAFTVAAPVEAESGSSSPTIPILEPVMDAAGQNPLLVGSLCVTLALIAAAAFLIRRHLRRARPDGSPANGTAGHAAWPAAEPLPDEGDRPALPAETQLLLALREELAREPYVERAWLLEREGFTVVAIEGARGTLPGVGARIVRDLQAIADDRSTDGPIRVAYVQGSGPVARAIGPATPFYRRPIHPGQFSA